MYTAVLDMATPAWKFTIRLFEMLTNMPSNTRLKTTSLNLQTIFIITNSLPFIVFHFVIQ